MEWYVLVEDWNRKEFKPYNIFWHYTLCKQVAKVARRRGITKEEFAKELRGWLMYCFWAKAEWEIVVTSWPPREGVEKKIDVWDQLEMNFDRLLDYMWNNLKEVKKLDKDM